MASITTKPIRSIGLALIVGALLLASPLAAQKNFNQDERETMEKYKRAKVHFIKGVEYLSKGKLEKVQKEADASLEIFPGYADAHLLLAQLQYQRRNMKAPSRDGNRHIRFQRHQKILL